MSVTACKKSNNNSNVAIPNATVDINLYINNPSYVNLNSVGGWVYETGGVRGIIVYKSGTNEFKAYERNCTYQSNNLCATVSVDVTNILVVDSCCHSKFLLLDGSVSNGPATFPLKQYNTTFDGNILHIYN